MFKFPTDFPQYSQVLTEKTNEHTAILNDQEYLVSVFLDNKFDPPVEIPVERLVSLTLEDNLIGFKQTGTLVFSNPNLAVQRTLSSVLGSIGVECTVDENDDIDVKDFTFRGEGMDFIHIKIMPILHDITQPELQSNIIMHTYCITDVNDGNEVLADKTTTLQLEGVESYIPTNFKLFDFKSGQVGSNPNTSPTSSTKNIKGDFADSVDKTGEVVYDILYKLYYKIFLDTGYDFRTLLPLVDNYVEPTFGQTTPLPASDKTVQSSTLQPKDLVVNASELTNRFGKFRASTNSNQDGTLTRYDARDFDVWDFGHEKSMVYTTMKDNENFSSLLKRLTDAHTSKYKGVNNLKGITPSKATDEFDPCILKLQRPKSETDTPSVSLRPFVSYFDMLGDIPNGVKGMGYMDSFVFEAPKETDNTGLGMLKGMVLPIFSCTDAVESITSDDLVTNFSFTPLSQKDSAKFIRTHVTRYIKGDAYEINMVDGSFLNTKAYISQNYLTKIIPRRDINADRAFKSMNIIDPNGHKEDINNALTFTSPYQTRSSLVAFGRNRLIKTMLLLNDNISFTVKGEIKRESGQFFGVDLQEGSDDRDENYNRLLGVYWGTNVTHEFDFSGKKYTNTLTGVKSYTHSPSEVVRDEGTE